MKVAFYLSKNDSENYVIRSLCAGCPETTILVEDFKWQPADVAVVFGVYKKLVPVSFPRGAVIAEQKKYGGDSLILETGYVHRGAGPENYYAAGWNGLNGRANFMASGMSSDRCRNLPPLKPWRVGGEKILLIGQVPWDASVDFTNHIEWLVDTAEELMRLSPRQIVFRPHPLAMLPGIDGCEYSRGRPLVEDLKNAHAVVTFNSNSAVEAAIEGVPVFATDIGSMVWDIANRSIKNIEEPDTLVRSQWYADLAYKQWLPSEMAEGLTWKHLARVFGKPETPSQARAARA